MSTYDDMESYRQAGGYRQMTISKEPVFRIERAAEGDWSWIVQGEVEIARMRLGKERQQEISRTEIEKRVAQRVAELRKDEGFHNEAFLARAQDGTPAGFVWVARDQNDSTGQLEALLLNQYVAEAYRGQELGHRLMETAEKWAREQGLPCISLAVGVHNTIGQMLYESLGYQPEVLRMSKKLDSQASDEILLVND
jgi:ribosomal protein S18 acetylase RimI-like enzyme